MCENATGARVDAADRGAFRVSYAARHAGTTDRRVHARSAGLEVQFNNCMRRSQEVHPDSAVRVRSDLLRWIMGFSSLTRMGWALTNHGQSLSQSPSVL